MGGIREALRRLGRYLADKEPVRPPTRLSEEEVVALARIAAEREGHFLEGTIGVMVGYDDAGRIIWRIMSNADMLGGHVVVRIDDATGETVAVRVLPR